MANEGFFRRWARLKAGDAAEAAPSQPSAAAALQPVAQAEPHPPVGFPPPEAPGHPPVGFPSPEAPARPPPTLDDVAMLGPDSDFSAFVTRDVDKAVQRLAMKKLFADPHFRLGDGLDVYIDDYTRPDPVSAAMLASLAHARTALARAFEVEAPPDEPGQEGSKNQPPGGEAPPPPQGNA